MFGHPKLVLNMLRVATKEFPDPHLPTEDGGVIGLFEKGLLCIPGCPSISSYGHNKCSSPSPIIGFLFSNCKTQEQTMTDMQRRCAAVVHDYIIQCHVYCFSTFGLLHWVKKIY